MHAFEIEYLVFGGFNITACLVMIVVYTVTTPWWRNMLGRMMVAYAAADMIMASLLMATVVGHFAPHWFRTAWFALQTVVGAIFWFQTAMIIKLHRERVSLLKREESP